METNNNLDTNVSTKNSEGNDPKTNAEKTDFSIVGMPGSSIGAGFPDVVSTVETMQSKITSYLEHKPHAGLVDQDQTDKSIHYLEKIIALLRLHTGNDFSSYKRSFIQRRIKLCMGIHQIEDIATYVRFLEENPQELKLLFKEFLIGVTRFFREPMEWELLKDKVIPELLAQRSPNDSLRVWISGCSTGEEAYSLAIVLKEVLDQLKHSKDFSTQIFATDLDCKAIDKAREGVFSVNIAEDMSTECLNRYFVKLGRGYQVIKPIRDMVIFAQQNMIKDPPFTTIDLLICRNLLIYLIPEIQKKIIPLFHYSLNSDGFLFLGSAESVRKFTNLFKQLDRKSRLYKRLRPLIQNEPIEYYPPFATGQSAVNELSDEDQNMQSLAYKLVLQSYSPATVFVNGKGDILYITGRTGKYLEPAAGKSNWNVFSMARHGLNYKLSEAFYQALQQKEAVTFKNVVMINENEQLVVDISINPLKEPGALCGMVMIIFTDVLLPNVNEIEKFKSSNKKMQSFNEELQSKNKELTTIKEVIQSSNEELKVINFELQAKLDDLSVEMKDMKNLMNSMKIATLSLDNRLFIKHFTDQMTEVSRLISSDVGRPITDIVSNLIYPELTEDVREVQRTLVTIEKQVMSYKGSWFNVCILPYQTLNDKSDGVVITFEDITTFKELEAELNKIKLVLEQHCRSRASVITDK